MGEVCGTETKVNLKIGLNNNPINVKSTFITI
jgi:hypothetical protein